MVRLRHAWIPECMFTLVSFVRNETLRISPTPSGSLVIFICHLLNFKHVAAQFDENATKMLQRGSPQFPHEDDGPRIQLPPEDVVHIRKRRRIHEMSLSAQNARLCKIINARQFNSFGKPTNKRINTYCWQPRFNSIQFNLVQTYVMSILLNQVTTLKQINNLF